MNRISNDVIAASSPRLEVNASASFRRLSSGLLSLVLFHPQSRPRRSPPCTNYVHEQEIRPYLTGHMPLASLYHATIDRASGGSDPWNGVHPYQGHGAETSPSTTLNQR